MNLNSPIREIKGIGVKTEQLFQQLGVYTVGDILLYFPRDYEKYPALCEVEQLLEDRKNALYICVKKSPTVNTHSRQQVALLDVKGETKALRLIWFRSPYIRSLIRPGGWYVFYGKVSRKEGRLVMEQPQIFSLGQYEALQKTLQPHYSLTKGITNNLIVKTMHAAMAEIPLEMEYLPEDIRVRNHLSEYNFALKNMHFPESEENCIIARNRFVFDEFFFFLLSMQLSKENTQKLKNEFTFAEDSFVEDLMNHLPYELTSAQKRAVAQIRSDLREACIMQRLVQGDVGSGKTIVAFLAMLEVAHNGYQAALMAPTEVLAQQHYEKLTHFLETNGIEIPVVLLTGSMGVKKRRAAYAILESDQPALVVGTHALIQEKVQYRNLALVITDEQHRFGVKQRETFSLKGSHPHILVMSATPIPRTLAIILYGDLDISIIDELPAKRLPIKNCVVGTSYRPKAYSFIEKQVQMGRQAYVICPMVEESEGLEAENVTDYARKLQEILPGEIKVEILHGKMKPKEKNRIMEAFASGEIQVLVSTTVVEVGVNVPNATVMMVENAERFGLAQLHQLRGRVGRGEHQSYCIFIQGNNEENTSKRLKILNESNDGFYIAGEDLKLRGPGDLFGIRQSGLMEFKIGDIYNDAGILKNASEAAGEILALDFDLILPQHKALKEHLKGYMSEELENLGI